LWRLTSGAREANIGAVEAHNEAVLANNRDLHHFDEEPDLDPHQSEKLRVVEANKWCHGG
jgi:hypothetical protein